MIEINNLTAGPVNESFLKKTAETVLKRKKLAEKKLSIALIGEKKIKDLNKKYRGKDRPTDVLAFPGDKEAELGEIVICPEKVKKNAKRFNSAYEKELVRVLIHGILHLLGHDHERSEIEAKRMVKKEEYYLSLLRP